MSGTQERTLYVGGTHCGRTMAGWRMVLLAVRKHNTTTIPGIDRQVGLLVVYTFDSKSTKLSYKGE